MLGGSPPARPLRSLQPTYDFLCYSLDGVSEGKVEC